MKKNINLILLSLALFAAGACTPKEQPMPDAEFSLSVREDRQGRILDWTVSPSNVITVPVSQQKLQELWVTAHNVCTLTASSTDPVFEGVNVSSSDSRRVKVEKTGDSPTTFRLVYAGPTDDGKPVTITATAGTHSHSFKVSSKQVIEAEYMVMTFTDGEYTEELKAMPGVIPQEHTILKKTIKYHGLFDPFEDGVEFTIDIYPENCSWTYFKSVGLYNDKAYSDKDRVSWTMAAISRKKFPDNYLNLGTGDNFGLTMNDIKGRKGWLAASKEPSFIFELLTEGKDVVNPETTMFEFLPGLSYTDDSIYIH